MDHKLIRTQCIHCAVLSCALYCIVHSSKVHRFSVHWSVLVDASYPPRAEPIKATRDSRLRAAAKPAEPLLSFLLPDSAGRRLHPVPGPSILGFRVGF